MARKVKFESQGRGCSTMILVNDKVVGYISAGADKYVELFDTRLPESQRQLKSVARFRYAKPAAHAKAFCKIVLGELTPITVIDVLVNQNSQHNDISPLALQHQITAGTFKYVKQLSS